MQQLLSAIPKYTVQCLGVANKFDKPGESIARKKFEGIEKLIYIVALERKHIDVLIERLLDTVLTSRVQKEDTIITNARHYHAIQEVAYSMADIKK